MMTVWLRATTLATIALLAPGSSLVRAEPFTTTQAQADDGTFLDYAPPPASRGGLCLVDTGINSNPDTQNSVVLRTAIDGESGNDTSPTAHGTILAMLAAAPINNWGMVGTAPNSIQIVSVRILEPGQTTFPFNYYADGITVCLQLRKTYNIKAINLSLGTSETPSSEAYTAVGNAIERANNYGVAVVAAAGNDNGGPVGYPAAYPGVLSVGASDTQGGGFCSFSNRGTGLRLLAPGCDLQAADPTSGIENYDYWQGTSEASVIAAAALDALLAYKPTLSPQTGEEYLANNEVLDIAAAFRNAGLATLVSESEADEPHESPVPPSPAPPNPEQMSPPPPSNTTSGMTPADPPQNLTSSTQMPSMTPLPRPRAQLKRHADRLVLTLQNATSEALTEVRYLTRRKRHLQLLRARVSDYRAIAAPATQVAAVKLRYTDPYDPQRDSRWVQLAVPLKR